MFSLVKYNSNLISIITKDLDIKKNNFLPNFLEQLINSECVSQTTINEILIKLYININSSLENLIYIRNKNTLQLILNFELEQIQSYTNESSKHVITSYLLLFKGCSDDLKYILLNIFIHSLIQVMILTILSKNNMFVLYYDGLFLV